MDVGHYLCVGVCVVCLCISVWLYGLDCLSVCVYVEVFMCVGALVH